MEPKIRRLTNKYSVITAVTSFVTQPIPGADELIVVPIHYYFSASLTWARGAPLLRAPWFQVSKIIWGGAAVRLFANFTLGLVPVAGLFSNAITAVALTELLGRYLDGALSSPAAAPPISLRAIRDVVAGSRRARRSRRSWPAIRRAFQRSVPRPTPA
ncbi:hypothetical protein BE21_34530 [Sorangium cellulosum]|uniref:Uncharacterized protein n=1 Tax=Sorangium cellulosum TaxID=56 RepID=A0A150TP64_SORCE|nr:hypothetical protein BE21_34530 [Sorangium cellulosum]